MRRVVLLGLSLLTAACREAGPSQCGVGGAVFDAGAADPANPCAACTPSASRSAFSPVADGTGCGAGKVCRAGACEAACFIAGAVVASGAVDPSAECRACVPGTSVDAYGARADGTPCAQGFCSGGACVAGCFVDGGVFPATAADPGSECRSCAPATATTRFTPKADGTACSNGRVCSQGTCQLVCVVDGGVFQPDAGPFANPCRSCQPGVSTNALTNLADGTSCGTGLICAAGQCAAGCIVDGGFVAAGAAQPGNPCRTCLPAVSTTDYSDQPLGTTCGAGLVCAQGQCVAGCVVDGGFVDAGAPGPGPCSRCVPATSTTRFSLAPAGTPCSACNACSATGACEPTVLVADLTGAIPLSPTIVGDRLYFTANRRDPCCNSAIYSVLLDGGALQTHVNRLYSPLDLAVLGDDLFFPDWQGNRVGRSPLTTLGADGGVTIHTGANPRSVATAAGSSRVFVAAPAAPGSGFPGLVRSFEADGGGVAQFQGNGGPDFVRTDGTVVVWLDGFTREVRGAFVNDAGSARTLGPALGEPRALLLHGGNVYWGTADGGVYAQPFNGGAARTLAQGRWTPAALATDGVTLYVANNNNGFPGGSTFKLPLDGGAVVETPSGGSPWGIAVDNQCVYWTTFASFGVRKTDK